jgi:hypothetical protein
MDVVRIRFIVLCHSCRVKAVSNMDKEWVPFRWNVFYGGLTGSDFFQFVGSINLKHPTARSSFVTESHALWWAVPIDPLLVTQTLSLRHTHVVEKSIGKAKNLQVQTSISVNK